MSERLSVTDGGVPVESERALEQLHEIASDRELSGEEKIEAFLDLGCERLGTESAFLTRIEDGTQEIVQSVGDRSELQPGSTAPLEEAYCRHTIGESEPLAIQDAPADDWEDDPAYERFGLGCYLGVTIYVDDEQFGTVCFADAEPRETAFSDRETTFVELLTDWIHEILERQVYEQELRDQQAFTEGILNSLPDPVYVHDREGTLISWNDRFETVTGYDADDIEEMTATDFVVEDDRERIDKAMAAVWDGEQVSVEARIERQSGTERAYELSGAPLRDEAGEVVAVAGVGRDVTRQQQYEQRLSGILETTRSLMQARDRKHVAELAVNAAANVLGFEMSAFRLYDGEAGTLEPAAITDATREALGERPVYDVGSGRPGEVFASGEPLVLSDVADDELGPVRSAMYYPVGVHGTISVGSAEPDAFDEADQQVLALLATTAAAACMRAKRESEVREAREHTEQVLDRINGLIEDTVEVLVQETTREELEDGVVTELAAADPYTFAWIGRPNVASETLSPTAWEGSARLPVQGRSFDLSRGDEPISTAYREGTIQVLDHPGEQAYGPWAEITADADVEALIAVPLVYKDTNYGVLAVCTNDAEAFDERERVVLEALGGAIANAINAIERGRILDATEIIELEFAVDDRDLLFSRLSAGSGSRIEVSGTDYRSDGSIRLYLSATDGDPADLIDLVENDGAVEEVTVIVDHDDECLLEVVVAESILASLTEYGAVPKEVVAEDGTARFTVELPYEAEARELFELVEGEYPGTDLLGYHERERPVETRQDFKAALSDRFTDRQETAIRTAFLGGFFDWPREVDGNELAEAMDISRPTYHQHLRTAERKVLEELFE